jgi:nucleoside-diphosphate-sugar epimerase
MRQLARAWIVGGGYLGAPLLARWVAAGVEVTAFTRSAEKAARLVDRGARGVELAGELDAVLPSEPADVVVWAVGFDRSSTREEAWLGGLDRLSAALGRRRDSPRVLYVSTTGVYGDAGGGAIDEATPPAPSSEGGRVALLAEERVRAFARESCAIRLAGIFGPGRLLQKIDEVRRGLVLRSPPEHWLNLVHVDDAVTLVDAVARAPEMPSIVNGAMADTPTRRRYYEALAKTLGAPAPRFEPPAESASGASARSEPVPKAPGLRGAQTWRPGSEGLLGRVGTSRQGEESASNRRVVSTVRAQLCDFRYEDVEAALEAVRAGTITSAS